MSSSFRHDVRLWCFRWATALVPAALLTLLLAHSLGCGLDWSPVRQRFNGVDPLGSFSYWETFGELDLGDGTALPLNIHFSSQRETSSPYLGAGWVLPILEARVTQPDTDLFDVLGPSGQTLRLTRDPATPSLLHGTAGWAGEIKGEMLTVWASCGWKLVYRESRLAEITTPKERRLEVAYRGALGIEVREQGETLFAVELDETGQNPRAFRWAQKRLEISTASKPRLQVFGDKTVYLGAEPSLHRLAFRPGESERGFEYDFDASEALIPSLKISRGSEQRLITWDPVTKRILSDGVWTYEMKFAEAGPGSVEIRRRNDRGETELWAKDPDGNTESTKNAKDDFVTVTTTYPKGGRRAGAIWKIERVRGDQRELVRETIYNEQGLDTIHTIYRDGSTNVERFSFNPDGKLAGRSTPHGKYSYTYDKQGRLLAKISAGITIWENRYASDGQLRQTVGPNAVTEYIRPNEAEWPGYIELLLKAGANEALLSTLKTVVIDKFRLGKSISFRDAAGNTLFLLTPDGRLFQYTLSQGQVSETVTKTGIIP